MEENRITTPSTNNSNVNEVISLSEKIQIIIGIITLFVAIISLLVACKSKEVADNAYDMAQSTYRHDSSTYSANLSITKNGDNVYIKSQDADLFEVNSIQFIKADEYYISKDNANTSIEMATVDCYLTSTAESFIDLNDVCIDISQNKTVNNKNYFSENDKILFDNVYKDKILELQRLYNVQAGRMVYHIFINYFNKYTYETKNLSITTYPDENGELTRIYPYIPNQSISIDLINNYQRINEQWNGFMSQINTVLENEQ